MKKLAMDVAWQDDPSSHPWQVLVPQITVENRESNEADGVLGEADWCIGFSHNEGKMGWE